MKCTECDYQGDVNEFRYHYNPRIDASITLRQCPECQAVVKVDELKRDVLGRMHAGEDPWGKSAGVENRADA